MKEIEELRFPDDLRYSQDHEWARQDGPLLITGISDYAQDRLGDVVFVELPDAGESFEKGEVFGTVESVKAVSELYMPVAGKIAEINSQLMDSPELVNNDPYGQGWMIKIEAADAASYDQMMDRQAYLSLLKG